MTVTLPLDQMTVAEKLELMEVLWCDLAKNHEDEIEPPEWHYEILEERERRIESGEAKFSDWIEVKERLRKELL